MKVLMLSHSNGGGGAGRAADRLFHALDGAGADLRMHVDFKHGDDPRVITNTGPLAGRRRSARIHIDEVPAVLARHPQAELFSPGTRSAISARRIESLGANVINLHWTNFGYLSVEDIGRIRSPLVWTLHDMWALTGGMNYDDDGPTARWRRGYEEPAQVPLRWDVERWVWRRKLRHWQRAHSVIAPSAWLAGLARQSAVLDGWRVHTIPNPLDIHSFAPADKDLARQRLGLDPHGTFLLVTMGTSTTDPRKGLDLLAGALSDLAGRSGPSPQLLVVGPGAPPRGWPENLIPTHWLGYLDDRSLLDAYNAADIAVVPSRQDNLPQTGTEAQACGVPVVAFNVGGLSDVVAADQTGLLAEPGDPRSLASAIGTLLASVKLRRVMAERARARAVTLWAPDVVAHQYMDAFANAIEDHGLPRVGA